MRISDWSSDVCSPDLTPAYFVDLDGVRLAQGDYLSLLSANSRSQIRRSIREYGAGEPEIAIGAADDIEQWLSEMRALNTGRHADNAWEEPLFRSFAHELVIRGLRSEEHTSELQSLMRISSAVFCLKKKQY